MPCLRGHRQPDEGFLEAEAAHAEAEIVVLGKAARVEQVAAGDPGEGLEAATAVAGGHARPRDHPGKRLAHDQVLAVQLREFVDVVAGDELVPLALEREDRHLDQVIPVEEGVEDLELERVDNVLGIVEDDALKADAAILLESEDAADDPVEAVGLAGRAAVRDRDLVHVGVAGDDAVGLADRLGVVRVDPDEDVELLVIVGSDCVLHHMRDDFALLPSRCHDGDGPLGPMGELGHR